MILESKHIQELISRVSEVCQPLRVILFGSAARGEFSTNSDLDILVVVPKGTHRRKTAQAIYRNLIGYEFAVDVIVVTEEDLELYGDNRSLVLYPALREGKEIYAA
ncbi:MAG: nucleotidyltransferase domain-containing protein [Methanobacteriota archaeon]|nr:MAG: nucleotidyltransferase domain-containing protein [Euryarchaeota archaeon]